MFGKHDKKADVTVSASYGVIFVIFLQAQIARIVTSHRKHSFMLNLILTVNNSSLWNRVYLHICH